jgi:hypothetical protein
MTTKQQLLRIAIIMNSSRMTSCPSCHERHLNLGALDCPYCGRALTDESEIEDHVTATEELLELNSGHFEVDLSADYDSRDFTKTK